MYVSEFCEQRIEDLTRLVFAAATSEQFRTVLMRNPATAIAIGYGFEQFNFNVDEQKMIEYLVRESKSLDELAGNILALHSKDKGHRNVNGNHNGAANGGHQLSGR